MKIDFPLPKDGRQHEYCINCRAETIERRFKNGHKFFYCSTCGQTNERFIFVRAGDVNWVAEDGEYWHTSAGIFVRKPSGKFLFFERTEFPTGFTAPAGHVEVDEDPKLSAERELEEEVGLQARHLRKAFMADIVGDSCSGGADAHRWHVFVEDVPEDQIVTVREEGKNPVWLTLEAALSKPKPFAIRYLLEHYRKQLEQA